MKKNTIKTITYFGVVLALTVLAVDPAMAQNSGLNRVTGSVKEQLPGVADVLQVISYILGVAFGIKAALKLKESNESKGQVPISQPITLAVIAGALLALPSLLKVAAETIFGNSTTTINADGGNFRSLN